MSGDTSVAWRARSAASFARLLEGILRRPRPLPTMRPEEISDNARRDLGFLDGRPARRG
jgi:hypothetical protein